MAQMPRMKGAVTGNFGRAKVKARPGTYEVSNYAMNKKGNLGYFVTLVKCQMYARRI